MPLLDKYGNLILDIFSRPIKAVGTWRDPQNCTQMASAIKALHLVHGHRSDYHQVCTDCVEAVKGSAPTLGCPRHLGQPQMWTKGDPTSSHWFSNHFRKIKMEMRLYKSKESSAITPREMLLLRAHLMANNDGYHFMIYTLCLLLTRLFMRNDDADSFHFNCFEEKYFIVSCVGHIVSKMV